MAVSEPPHRVILKVAVAIRRADQEAESVEPLLIAALLRRHLYQDVEVMARHYPDDDGDSQACAGCGFDIEGGKREHWPCPEFRSVAKSLGVEL